MSGGGGDSQTKTEMPKWYNAVAKPASQQIGGLTPQEFYPDPTFAPQSGYTGNAIAGLGNADFGQSEDYYRGVLNGDYLGLNPAFQDAVMSPAMDAVASKFAGAGRYGSPGSQYQIAKAGMQALAPYYDSERQRQGQSAAAIPLLQNQQWQNWLMGGGLQEQWGQKQIDENMARYNYDPTYANLQRQLGLLQMMTPGNVVTSSQGGGSQLAGAAGGALTGASAGSMFGPWGTAIGGIAGGALGLLGSS